MPIYVRTNVLADFLIVKTMLGLSVFEDQFGSVVNGLELANTLRDAMDAAHLARKRLSGTALQSELGRIVGETICHCPLPVKISVSEIIDGLTTIVEVPENLAAMLVDLTLLDITHETRCADTGCGLAIPKGNKFCKIHATRKARLERECRRIAAENEIQYTTNNEGLIV